MDADAAAGRVRTLLEELCREYAVPGAQVGLLDGTGRVVVCHGTTAVGDDARPVTASTAFHAGSVAKSLAGLLVHDAARAGLVHLDVPCADQADGLWDDTPRSIMAQVTGRPNLLPEPDETLEEFAARTADLPRVHPPGRFSYCNAGWPVLDLLLRRRTGSSFEQLAARALGAGTTFGMPPAAARGHGAAPGTAPVPVPSTYSDAASAAGSRWWATADQLLDYAALHLQDGAGRFHPEDVRALRAPHAPVPGATVSDSWGAGWALWDRGSHQAFGWAGYTGGHRAYLRCFPREEAAVVVLANCAGPLFGPPGGSALFDALLPDLLDALGVPALPEPELPGPRTPAAVLAGTFGPVELSADGDDALLLAAQAFGEQAPLRFTRVTADTFARQGRPPGGMTIAVDADLLYLGPFAVART